jgi:CHAD domain-containing protein
MPGTATAPKSESALESVLSERVRDLRRLLPHVVSGQEQVDAVHQARVTTRRLKAAVDLAEPVLSDHARKDFARALRRLRRELGPLRDVDVMLEHLRELDADARHLDAVRWLTGQLERQRAELQGHCCKKLSTRSRLSGLRAWDKLREQVRQEEPSIREQAAAVVPVQLAAFHDRAGEIARFRASHTDHAPDTAAAGAAPNGSTGTDSTAAIGPDVHQLRIAGKLLRYTLELAEPLGYRLSPSVLRTFKQLQESLGLWHDNVVLGERAVVTAADEMLSHHQPRLYSRVLDLAQMLWRRSERHLDRFDRLWTRRGERLSAQILRAFRSPPRRRSRKGSKRAAVPPQSPPDAPNPVADAPDNAIPHAGRDGQDPTSANNTRGDESVADARDPQ